MTPPQDTNTTRWWAIYSLAADYHAEHGHLRIPRSHTTPTGVRVGAWLHRQRTLHRHGALIPDRAKALERLSVIWHTQHADGEAAIRAFHTEHGHTNVPTSHVTADGFPLGTWVQSRRADHRNDPDGVRARYPVLTELGFTWQLRDPDAAWRAGISHLTDHTTRWGTGTWIPSRYTTPDGYPLGTWVMNRRADYWQHRLTPEQISDLEAAGIIWRHRAAPDTTTRHHTEDARFTRMVRHCQDWADTHNGTLTIPARHTTPDGTHLGRWLLRQRSLHHTGRLPHHRTTQLDAINPGWAEHTAPTSPEHRHRGL